MKTRIVKTKMWSDNRILKLSPLARFTFLFLLTSPYVGMTNYFECADVYIMAGTGIIDVEPIKRELQESGLVFFYEGWVFIPNLEKHNNYKNSPSNKKTYDAEVGLIPQANLDFFNTSVDTTVHSSNKTINKKQEIKNKKQKTKNAEIINQENINEVPLLIDLFKGVNPSYQRLFANKTERAACERLLKQYGLEKLTNLMEQLPGIISKPYAPIITSPYTLEVKMGSLIAFMQKEKSVTSKFSVEKL